MSLSVVIKNALESLGMQPAWADRIDLPLTIVLLLAFAYLVDYSSRAVLLTIGNKIAKRTKTTWDDILMDHGVIVYFCKMIAPIIIYKSIDTIAAEFSDSVVHLIRMVVSIYITIAVAQLFNAFFKSVYCYFDRKATDRKRPLKGILQTAQVILWIICSIVVVGLLINRSPLALLTGLGASAAVLMLVFKDSILGLVSGVQLSANNMLQVGDWITVPNYGADGNVLEVTLNTVKVQNWDNTIVTLPPYALVSGAFQNWKGMEQGGGRRIKRSINIDMHSVKFCTPEMLARFSKIDLLKDYLAATEERMESYNSEHHIDSSLPINGLHQTNLGVFRAYLTAYLNSLSVVNKEMTCMVRQLQPTEVGIPIELYFFSSVKEWVAYEGIQSDVFDHVLAVVPLFGLEVFQLQAVGK